MAQQIPSLVFTVRRKEPELVAPAKPTPRELKPLSGLDSNKGLRFYVPGLFIYKNNPSMNILGKEAVKVIREAIAKTLVFYYLLAGRLREGPGRELSVDCTGEGVLFIEADADVALDDFGAMLHPPFPCLDKLLPSTSVSDGPLVLIQVTRLKCGGFILAECIDHAMSDGFGMGMFLRTIGEMARGALAPQTLPCWNREFFRARDPPCVTHPYRDYCDGDKTYTLCGDIIEKSFYFGPSQVSALRRLVPQNLRGCSKFDVLTACLWRCHTLAFQFDPKDEVRLMFMVNARGLNLKTPLPPGYYGNAGVLVVLATAAENLCSFEYALELVRKGKADVSEEYIQSYMDLIAIKGFNPIPGRANGRLLDVSDLRLAAFDDVEFGWGRAVYVMPVLSSTVYYMNQQGEEGIVVNMSFPPPAMKIFENELSNMLLHVSSTQMSPFIVSAL